MQTNMLSTKKIKLHGMQSRRWKISDKITQYKGLVNLYARDKKILNNDTNVNRRKLKKEIRKLRKEINEQRDTLGKAIQGDKQRLRNTLSNNRNMQLAYQNMPASKVIDVLYQANFKKRKELDRIFDQMRFQTQSLINLKLLYADLEDRIKYESKEKIPVEEQAQILTVKVQDAILKTETARDVQDTYKSILNVLKKDAIYFDAVLKALHTDGYHQGKCILKVTEMGQLATEYLEDKKEEFMTLEEALKASMRERELEMKKIQNKLKALNDNVKHLIRRDDKNVVEVDKTVVSRHTSSEQELIRDIESMLYKMERIKSIAFVSKIEDIYPRIQDQKRQKIRLDSLVEKCKRDRNTLLERMSHAEDMYNHLCHTMVENTFEYREEKNRMFGEMQAVMSEKETIDELINFRGDFYIFMRTSLQQIAELLRNVVPKVEPPPEEKKERGKKKQPIHPVEIVEVEKIIKPEKVESDGPKLIEDINMKIEILVAEVPKPEGAETAAVGENEGEIPPLMETLPLPEEAPALFEKFVTDMTVTKNITDTKLKEESLITEEMFFEDSQVPNRAEIKARSAEICEKMARNEFDMPILTIKK